MRSDGIEEATALARAMLLSNASWAILGFVFNFVRRFIFVLLYVMFPKAKAEMALVARLEDKCDAALGRDGLGAAIGYWYGGRRYKVSLEDAREYVLRTW